VRAVARQHHHRHHHLAEAFAHLRARRGNLFDDLGRQRLGGRGLGGAVQIAGGGRFGCFGLTHPRRIRMQPVSGSI